MQQTQNKHISRKPYIQPYCFIPVWKVLQDSKKRQQERLLWAYANDLDNAIDYLKAEIDRININLQQFFN